MFNQISNVQLLHTFDVNIYLYPSASNPDSNPDSHLILFADFLSNSLFVSSKRIQVFLHKQVVTEDTSVLTFHDGGRYHIEASRLIYDNGLCHERVKELSVFLYTICHIIF